MKYQLYREQQLNCDIQTAWNFFSSPTNLAKITPKELGFNVLTNLKKNSIYEGMIICYKVSPSFKFPLKWETKITQVDENTSFTDFQLSGPYRYWSHFHEFIPNLHGVLMKDTIEYELPLGFLGKVAYKFFVKDKLEEIFNFRYKFLDEHFK